MTFPRTQAFRPPSPSFSRARGIRGLVAGVAAGLLLAATAPAQLNLEIIAGTTVVVDYYDEGYPPENVDPRLSLATVLSSAPGYLDYTVAAGTFQMDFLAPTGYRFSVNPLDGPVDLWFNVAYSTAPEGPGGGLSAVGPGTITFLGLEGTAPTFLDYSSFADYAGDYGPYAYLSVTLGASGVAEAFSFTGLRYTVDVSGTDTNPFVPYFEGGTLSVEDPNYFGLAPPDHAGLLTVTAIPEPATYAALAGFAALLVAGHARRRQPTVGRDRRSRLIRRRRQRPSSDNV